MVATCSITKRDWSHSARIQGATESVTPQLELVTKRGDESSYFL